MVAKLTSVPLEPRERWWTRLAKAPARIWAMSEEVSDVLTEGSHQQPSKRKVALIRFALTACFVLLLPLVLVFSLRTRRPTAYDALHARVREIWQTSAEEAIALLRSIHEQLVAQGALTKMKRVEIAPFGKFGVGEVISVQQFLYRCEVAVGNFEEALAVAAALPGQLEMTILQQVDCLVALGRKPEAIALLSRNLDLDGWRGKLRRRIVELGGRPLRSVD